MPDTLPSCLLTGSAPRAAWRPEALGLEAALDVTMLTLRGVAARLQPVPLSGPVGDDRWPRVSRAVGMGEALALVVWWNSPLVCQTLDAMPGGGLIEHGRDRCVPPALRQAMWRH